jgi:sulfate transport system permease protein
MAARALPGFRPALGFTLVYLSFLVLIPLSGVFVKTAGLSWSQYWNTISSSRAVASYQLTLGASAIAALINGACGMLSAWVLVRYEFPGRRLEDSLIALPLALPTAVAGIALTSLYAENGWLGAILAKVGWKVAFTPLGIIVALTFIGLPFVVRTVQPVLQDLEAEVEDAAASLGATRGQTFRRIILPTVLPALVTGTALAFARALGEYGSIVFISGNLPLKTEVTTLLIMTKLEQYDYRGATALATVMLGLSFVMLFAINLSQAWLRRRNGAIEEAA